MLYLLNRQNMTRTKLYSETKYGIHYYICFWCHNWPRSAAIVHSELKNKTKQKTQLLMKGLCGNC